MVLTFFRKGGAEMKSIPWDQYASQKDSPLLILLLSSTQPAQSASLYAFKEKPLSFWHHRLQLNYQVSDFTSWALIPTLQWNCMCQDPSDFLKNLPRSATYAPPLSQISVFCLWFCPQVHINMDRICSFLLKMFDIHGCLS